ncbi:PAS domain S-box protein [candidate division KSB1 bacterium]|nr:PAS domain S-box protein [candidate division KSB1 bacterium]
MKNETKTKEKLIQELETLRAKLAAFEKTEAEHKRTEDKLRKSEERFRKIVEYSNDAILIIDPERDKIIDVNPRACNLFEYSREELLSMPITAIHPNEMPELMAFSKSVLEQGEGWTNELSCLTKSGKTLPTEISASVIEIDGRPCMIALVRDITERKQAEAALRQSEKMASLGNLVAGLAHEINSPIGAINSAADTNNLCLKRIENIVKNRDITKNNDYQRALNILGDNIQITANAGERIAEIVKSLKNFARLDEAEFQQSDIHEGIDSTLTLLNRELKEKVTVIRDYGKIPKIFIYAGELNQVFMNILRNAIQAIENKGTIKIRTFAEKNSVCIQISDSGKGIPPENINRIFDPGFTTKGVGVGTGLALSICYQIIQKHMGEISVESQLGKGTTFTIILPMDLDKLIGKELEYKVK